METVAMKLKDAPWKKSCDKPRQCIKKQKYHFTNKGPESKLWFFQSSCMNVRVRPKRRLRAEELMPLNCGAGEDSRESLGLQGGQISQS